MRMKILFMIALMSGLLSSCKITDKVDERGLGNSGDSFANGLAGTDPSAKGSEESQQKSADSAEETKGSEPGKGDEADGESGKGTNVEPEKDIDPDATPDDHDSVDLDDCFQKMPKDRDPGPFFKEVKVVSSWRGRKRTNIKLVPIDPPPPGLNICKTVLDECIVCTPWEELFPEKIGDENACDDHAETCANETGKECKCVRS
jgi:hypothetical protein